MVEAASYHLSVDETMMGVRRVMDCGRVCTRHPTYNMSRGRCCLGPLSWVTERDGALSATFGVALTSPFGRPYTSQ